LSGASGGGTSFRRHAICKAQSLQVGYGRAKHEAFRRASFSDCQGKVFRVSTLATDWRLVAYIPLSDEVPCAPFTCPNWVPARLHARYRWRFGVAARWRQNKWKTCHPTSISPCARYRRGPRRRIRQGSVRIDTSKKQQGLLRSTLDRPLVMPCVAIHPNWRRTRPNASLLRGLRHDTRHTISGTVRPPASVPCVCRRVVCSTRCIGRISGSLSMRMDVHIIIFHMFLSQEFSTDVEACAARHI
jgi:hypothetical protein